MRRLSGRQRLAALVLAALSVCFITLDLTGGSLAGAHSGAQGALGSLYRGTDSVMGPARRLLQGLPHAGSNADKVQQLERENAALRSQLVRDSTDATMAAQLSRLQARADTLGKRVLPARVTAFGPGQGFEWTITLGVGSSDGVAVDQTVTDGVGLVGRVLRASADSSVVLLAADPGSGVGVRDVRSGQLAVATGAGSSGFTLSPLDPVADLKVGDELRTGPVGESTYVGDIPLGTITAVRTSADGATTAKVRPAASPTAVDLVGIILADAGASANALAPR
ncbi:rod shape-determining protein MreC [Frankineae bacterium MT45]|nr:rod shape-determining protein MreC [Frankineae bacterium MT45]